MVGQIKRLLEVAGCQALMQHLLRLRLSLLLPRDEQDVAMLMRYWLWPHFSML